MTREAAVRASFEEQAAWCERLGSPFTGRLCALMARRLDRGVGIGRRVLDWPGDPRPTADALALRLCGALHRLVRGGDAAELARLYPPAPAPDEEALSAALAAVLDRHGEKLCRWIESPPQTNEVGRSALLMSGLLAAADRFRLPLRLYELGASAGLNLLLDRYGYDLGGLAAGDAGSPVLIRPDWTGPPPPAASVRIVARQGVDLDPADAAADRDRLLGFIWPDQPARLKQIETALDLAAMDPPIVDRGDAADWIEARVAPPPETGVVRVVMHSVAFQYFEAEAQRRVAAHLDRVGGGATEAAPLAWLRFEKRPEDENYSLRLRLWPGEDRLLAWAHPHGRRVKWVLEGDSHFSAPP